jgi:hypothetical protein
MTEKKYGWKKKIVTKKNSPKIRAIKEVVY